MLDHIERKTLKLANVRYFVLDEGDEMLDMGFRGDIEKIGASVANVKNFVSPPRFRKISVNL